MNPNIGQMQISENSDDDVPEGYYKIELNKTVWIIPTRYQNPVPVGKFYKA